ncbi:MAG TPA: SIR2 family protein, partial [Thermoanaerobaculia bacterium]
ALKGSPPATFDAFCRIASATQFFGRGDDRRAAHLLKIHGCAESYRWARKRGKDSLHAYLPALVFTFREIQNWREDSWSRDLVSTLLRTRTIVFCGYSTADPVLHDTIRTVYEEMARRRGKNGKGTPKEKDGSEAPAFFLGGEGKTEFHGMEILRAASRAVGLDPGLTDHSNYLRFHFVKKAGEVSQPFPTLDEMMRWLFHLTFRRRQRQAVDSDLGRVVTLLLGHPCPEAEQRAVKDDLEKLFRAEKTAALRWNEEPSHRFQFERIVGWTERFQVGLMRELALADASLRSAGPGIELMGLRRSRWYYPALDHTDWAAWGAVVELALRRRISALRQQTRGWMYDQPWLTPGAGEHPSVLYALDKLQPTPFCLTIRLRPPGRRGRSPAVRGARRHQLTWDLGYADVPWPRRKAPSGPGESPDAGPRGKKAPGPAEIPDAVTIWEWAHAPFNRIGEGSLETLI